MRAWETPVTNHYTCKTHQAGRAEKKFRELTGKKSILRHLIERFPFLVNFIRLLFQNVADTFNLLVNSLKSFIAR